MFDKYKRAIFAPRVIKPLRLNSFGRKPNISKIGLLGYCSNSICCLASCFIPIDMRGAALVKRRLIARDVGLLNCVLALFRQFNSSHCYIALIA